MFLFLALMFVGLKGNLKDSVPERVPVQRLNGDHGFVVIRHGNEAEALALVRLQVPYHLDVLNRAERSE